MKEAIEKLSEYLTKRAGSHIKNASDKLFAGQKGQEVDVDLETGRKLLEISRGVERFWINLGLDLEEIRESIPPLEEFFPTLRPEPAEVTAPAEVVEIPITPAKLEEIPQPVEISEEEKQRREQLLLAISKYADVLTKGERMALESGVIFSENNLGTNKDWGALYDPEAPEDLASHALVTMRIKAAKKVKDDIALVSEKTSGREFGYYLKFIGQPEVIGREVMVDGKLIEFPPRTREAVKALRAVADTSEENQITFSDFVLQVYGNDTPQNRKKAQSLVPMVNRRVLVEKNLQIIFKGRGDERSVYLKRLAEIIRGGAIITTPTFTTSIEDTQTPDEYAHLISHPEVVKFIDGIRGVSGMFLKRVLSNIPSRRRLCQAIAKHRDLPKNFESIRDFEMRLDAAILEEAGFLFFSETFGKQRMKVLSPNEVFNLYTQVNPQYQVKAGDQYGLFSGLFSGDVGISVPDGLVIDQFADEVRIRKLIEYKNINGSTHETNIEKQGRTYNSQTVKRDLKVNEDPALIRRVLHNLRPDIADMEVAVSPTLEIIYGIPDNSRLLVGGITIPEKVPISTTEIHAFGLSLRKILIPTEI